MGQAPYPYPYPQYPQQQPQQGYPQQQQYPQQYPQPIQQQPQRQQQPSQPQYPQQGNPQPAYPQPAYPQAAYPQQQARPQQQAQPTRQQPQAPQQVAQRQSAPASDGLLVQVRDLTVTVPDRARIGTRTLLDHVSVDFRPAEVTALIGPSGCGKSTLLKAICGISQADRPKGEGLGVFFNGHPYYDEMESLSHRIAYLPQADSDWMHDDLTATQEVDYTWRLRETGRSSTDAQDKSARRGEIRAYFRRRGLLDHCENRISTLSGGQKKMTATIESMAANPELLLLDEPTAPLDPGSSASFVEDLVETAHENRLTTIMVTHDPIALRGLGPTCHVILMRKGGTIAFDGTYEEFGRLLLDHYQAKRKREMSVDDAIQGLFKDFANDIIPPFMERDSDGTSSKPAAPVASPANLDDIRPAGFLTQLAVLLRRETRLLVGRGLPSLTLALMPLVLGGILGWVAGANGDSGLYSTYMMTQAMMFSLSACSFFVGVFDSIESFANKRQTRIEELHGMRAAPYVLAVALVMTALTLVQSLLLFLTFTSMADLPPSYLYDARFDMFLTTFLCAHSAAMLGMLCSAVFRKSTYMAPVLVIIQIVFSGMIFSLEGVTRKISMFVSCHWAMNALAALCDLNNLPTYVSMPQVGKVPITYTNSEFAAEGFTLFTSWMMLSLLGLGALVLCMLVMSASRRVLFHPDFLGARSVGHALATAKQVATRVAAPVLGAFLVIFVLLAIRGNAGMFDPAGIPGFFSDLGEYLGTLFGDFPGFVRQLMTEGL